MRFGELDGSKFGYSISSLGDINKDGFEGISFVPNKLVVKLFD